MKNPFRGTLPDAWAGLRAAPARALLTYAALAAGLAAATLLLAATAGLDREARTLTAAFGADSFALLPDDPAPDAPPWTRDAVDTLRHLLRDRAWVSGARAVHTADRPCLATDEHWTAAHGWHILRGRPLDAADIHTAAPVLLTHSPSTIPADPALPVTLSDTPLRWIGATDAPADTPPCIPWTLTALDDTPAPPARDIDRIWFRARPGHSPEAIRRMLSPRLPLLGLADSRWVTPETLLADIRRWQRTLAWTAGGGSLLGLLLGATSLTGLLLAGVRERIPEIGLRRAIGATPTDIAALFVAEALILTLASAATGILSAALLLHAAGSSLPLPWALTPSTLLTPLFLSLLLAALSSALPSLTASRLPPAEALRND